ncbi:RluA family pseudouridine synthase [Merismopedia glauca]|uniref:RNA pseudouridylate synthase n=1 Tax=Merismopedia glauca CCAP 1448/3 TaxID=1296344 RepID=A0A2T1C3V0_9CYAN|nr:RluA family pseudouridine synthase [Merismopedia glauca]PSB02929.1 RNA pseudouridine synthase [Merismopedia glauca CCAP 1448/3]
MLHLVSDFINRLSLSDNSPPSYWYQGYNPESGELLKLPRTSEVEAIAHGLMAYIAEDEIYAREGKMYGVLLVALPDGERRVLKAFSGLLNGSSIVEGWVPPIPGREAVSGIESQTLSQLAAIKQELITLKQLPERQEYAKLVQEFEQRLQVMSQCHTQRKQQRHAQRLEYLTEADLAQLEAESRQDKRERKQLKQQRDTALSHLKALITAADSRISELKQQRRELSRQLQLQMHDAYLLMNFAGKSRSLKELIPQGLPTGTGDCCAPKLLHYAAENALKPLAMAEFWWGNQINDKIAGEFYPACTERCQPIMGFLLSGLSEPDLSVIYQDECLIAINKPSGLLSVPGRYLETQDSVLSRLRDTLPEIRSVHRLDLETSGILLFAKDANTYTHLSQQFQNRQVQKVYEAVLDGTIEVESGIIDLPLWGNPEKRPFQEVNWECGKASLTKFQILAQEGKYTRIQFMPITGRTHQLRVHAADQRGLGIAILGDRLYGCNPVTNRLHLHARELSFQHPQSGKVMRLQVKTPF